MFWFKKKRNPSVLGELDRLNRQDIQLLEDINLELSKAIEMSMTSINYREEKQDEIEKDWYLMKDIVALTGIDRNAITRYCTALENQGKISHVKEGKGKKYSAEDVKKIIAFHNRRILEKERKRSAKAGRR